MNYNPTPFRIFARGETIIREDLNQANTNFQTIHKTLSPSSLPFVYEHDFEPPVGAVYEHVSSYTQANLNNLSVITIPINLNIHEYGVELMVFPSNLRFSKFSFTLSSPEIKVEFTTLSTFFFYKCQKLKNFIIDQFEHEGVVVNRTYKIPSYTPPPFHLHFHQPTLINSQQPAQIYIYLRRIA